MEDAVKRPYSSMLRRANAESTRLVIIRAATELFEQHGYGATSIDMIADAAGISRATVFNSVGGKATLLRAAYDVAIVGDDEPIPLPKRPWAQPVRNARDAPTMLVRYAHMVTVIDGRVASIWEVMRGAASAHPDVLEHWNEIRAERRVGSKNVIAMVKERGGLRPGLPASVASDIVLVLIDPGLYHQLVEQCGWKPSGFEAWLADTLRAQLLGP